MEILDAVELVELLADGVDPISGAVYPPGSPWQHPEVVRALKAALDAMYFFIEAQRTRSNQKPQKKAQPVTTEAAQEKLTAKQELALSALRVWRMDAAKRAGVSAFVIAHDKWLMAIVRKPVRSHGDLASIKGFAGKRAVRYGEDILAVLAGQGISD